MGPLWHPRQQYFAWIHGHGAERGPRARARSRRVGAAQPHWQNGGSRGADRSRSSAVQRGGKLYHGHGFSGGWRPNLFLTEPFSSFPHPQGPFFHRRVARCGGFGTRWSETHVNNVRFKNAIIPLLSTETMNIKNPPLIFRKSNLRAASVVNSTHLLSYP